MARYRCVLLDIEGTTTPIEFVHQVLFPYARANLRAYLDVHFDAADPVFQALMSRAATDAATDPKERVVAAVTELMDRDEKFGPLKELQGRIWQSGFAAQLIFGQVFDDVMPCIRRWREGGLAVCIYSSGSVAAQKLLFGHLPPAHVLPGEDTLGLFGGFFDTAVGAKVEASSYLNIAQLLSLAPSEILFLTDRAPEAVAARAAGVDAMLLDRPGNGPLTPADRTAFRVLQSFAELDLF
jgi:enolase-phosphatase E1